MNDEDMQAFYTYFKQDVKASAQKNYCQLRQRSVGESSPSG